MDIDDLWSNNKGPQGVRRDLNTAVNALKSVRNSLRDEMTHSSNRHLMAVNNSLTGRINKILEDIHRFNSRYTDSHSR
ncbi:MAG: hypothetical protein MPK62_02005 [Alphaproteobacteria bacterium]|nr:hypothetical protein [Alphaproteobacteria bacterium]MDA8029907.1 hypothetical protein [Alphaproteobacteria bacterium]